MSLKRLHEKPLVTIHGGEPGGDTLAYLATPYTKYKAGREAAFREAARIAGTLVCAGLNVFSPIVHGHAMCAHSELDPLGEFWARINEPYMRRCEALIIAEMDGWKDSAGTAAEIRFFMQSKTLKAVFQLDPSTFVMRRIVTRGAQA